MREVELDEEEGYSVRMRFRTDLLPERPVLFKSGYRYSGFS
jgi:hypothetical protein